MKAYGLKEIEYADIVDIQDMASKSSAGKLPEKSGDYKSYIRSTKSRNQTRRYWKKKARKVNKLVIEKELNEMKDTLYDDEEIEIEIEMQRILSPYRYDDIF